MLEIERTRDSKGAQSGTATARALYRQTPAIARAVSAETNLNPSSSVTTKSAATARITPANTGRIQTRTPVITGEVNYKGMLPIDGILTGQLGGNGGSLAIRQKLGNHSNGPELEGEISFRDVVRVNGHIAGTVYSEGGTLMVDDTARVDADIEVAIAVINGTINGDIVAHQKVEIGPAAKIYGNIWTRSIAIKDGAEFEGVCTMIED
ncbi:MAG TPA: polymer-forming cytoskeletal protein [Pyrinomonadaceae bacterium]|jgi:cytoskeletal protein CcmA (bactofilin family)|nr:polymer-forming cytoskeletal protein [Pyrinomonadaceae bacterium]